MVTIVFLFFFLSQCYISILSIPDYIKKKWAEENSFRKNSIFAKQ